MSCSPWLAARRSFGQKHLVASEISHKVQSKYAVILRRLLSVNLSTVMLLIYLWMTLNN
jgi:hypothetical protein